MSRKIKIPKIVVHYIGNDSPEQKKRAEEHVNRALDLPFRFMLEDMEKEKKAPTEISKVI